MVCGLDKSEIVKSLTCCTEGTFRESEAKKVKNPKIFVLSFYLGELAGTRFLHKVSK